MISHHTQHEDYGKFSHGDVHSQNTVVDHDHDDFDFDKEISRHRSKLRVLYHAATCPCEKLSFCPAGVVHCCASKRVFAHITTCTSGNDCDVPGCQHSKRVWNHYLQCRRNIERSMHRDARSSTNKTCDICSAVPVCHDKLILCNRFRTKTALCQPAATSTNDDSRNTTTSENEDVDGRYFAAVRGRDIQSLGSQEEYSGLPVWRKRNLLHAQQQQQLPRHEKENTTSSTKFTEWDSEQQHFRGRAALHDSNGSINQSASQIRGVNVDHSVHKKSNDEIKNKHRASFSAIPQNKFNMLNGMANDSSYSASPGFRLPHQLPVHPRDAKRKSKSAAQSINRRYS